VPGKALGGPARAPRRALLATAAFLAGLLLLLGALGLACPGPGLAAGEGARPAADASAVARAARAISPGQELTPTVWLPVVVNMVPEVLTPNSWQGEYYANATLTGEPAYTTEDERRVDFDWGDGGAPPGLPADSFSVRWTGDWDFEAGTYTFFLFSDDGVKLRVDGELLINAWVPGIGLHTGTVSFETAGLHRLELEYFEQTGDAAVRLHWRRTDLYPQWHGDYYGEPWVEGGWQYARTDSVIQFDWGLGAPEGLPTDGFSVSWTARRLFEAGTHRFFLYADEGYQLYVDGSLKKEGGWYDGQVGGAVDVVYTLEVAGLEYHDLTYIFHDRGTLAEARLWSEYLEHPTWRVEFYDNTSLSGTPVIDDPDGQKIFFDWGLDRPRPTMPSADGFSIRWSGQRHFHAGCYRFGLFADDGVRLWVDGEQLVDEWHPGRAEYHGPVTYLSSGYHEVIVEYYENVGEAEIRFWWE
jgi:hypothetical protein